MKKKVVFALLVVVCSITFASALNTWTDAYTYTLNDYSNWKTVTTSGTLMGQDKSTNAAYYDVFTVSKTSIGGEVKFRLVNSENSVRSDELTTTSVGMYKRGYGNTGVIGHALYGSVKPMYGSTGSIKLQMKVY